MMQIDHDGYQTQWFDLFKCSKLFVYLAQPLSDLSQPPALSLQWPLQLKMMQIGHDGYQT